MTKQKEISGLDARVAACKALNAWFKDGEFIAAYLNTHCDHLKSEDKNLAMELALGVCRNHVLLEYNVMQFCSKKPSPDVKIILMLAFYQLQFLSKIPDYAIVDTSVNLAKQWSGKGEKVAGFVNAVLRNLKRKGFPALPRIEDNEEFFSLRYSTPKWLVKKWLKEFGDQAAEMRLRHSLIEPQSWVRINWSVVKAKYDELDSRAFVKELCKKLGLDRRLTLGRYLPVLEGLGAILKSEEFKRGIISVQDPASALVVSLLQLKKGQKVLDACAAPGGKTALMLDMFNNKLEVTASDLKSKRLNSLDDISNRLHLQNFTTQRADLTKSPFKEEFDRVLVDAPCSNLGVLSRRPELRLNITPDTLKGLKKKQLQILEGAAKALKPGGILVYATCSPEKEETSDVVDAFLKENKEFKALAPDASEIAASLKPFKETKVDQEEIEDCIDGKAIRILPGMSEFDGFYGIAIKKKG